jgi:hypothetical protein
MYARVCALLVSSCLYSQSHFNGSGTIQTRPGVDPSQFTVEVEGHRFGVASNGRFDLTNLPRGASNLRVVDESGRVVAISTIHPESHAPVEVRVSAGFARTPAGPAATVSVASLRSDPDGKAEKEFRYALWEANAKDWKAAAKHFEKALKIDARHTRAAANWSAMEVQLGNYARAEEIARRGLRHEPSNGRLLHALGMSLLGQRQLTDEAVTALADAGREIPKVLLMAAQAEYVRGNWDRTQQLADAYLSSGEKEFREIAERLKTGVRSGQGPRASK